MDGIFESLRVAFPEACFKVATLEPLSIVYQRFEKIKSFSYLEPRLEVLDS